MPNNSYESFLRERWFAVSQDAARAEAILELILEAETPDCRLSSHLKWAVQKFLKDRQERRKAAQARLDALEVEREAERKGREG